MYELGGIFERNLFDARKALCAKLTSKLKDVDHDEKHNKTRYFSRSAARVAINTPV